MKIKHLKKLSIALSVMLATQCFISYANIESSNDTKNNKLKLWYDKPATDWENQALPIGNGYMGGMLILEE